MDLRQRCLLPPYLCIPASEVLTRAMKKEKRRASLMEATIDGIENLVTHLLFTYNLFFSGTGYVA